jgi:hypothetical protein
MKGLTTPLSRWLQFGVCLCRYSMDCTLSPTRLISWFSKLREILMLLCCITLYSSKEKPTQAQEVAQLPVNRYFVLELRCSPRSERRYSGPWFGRTYGPCCTILQPSACGSVCLLNSKNGLRLKQLEVCVKLFAYTDGMAHP